jgi:putative two-component system response regulator
MQDTTLRDAQILLVDDHEANVRLLERILQQAGYTNLRRTTDPRQVLSLFAEVQPDLVVLDLHMPHLDGFAVLDQLRPLIPAGTYLPILVLSADITRDAKQRALQMGAKDFLTKPLDQVEVLLRIKNLLETRFLHRALRAQNQQLEQRVRERTRSLEGAQLEILERLARAAEYRDDDTGEHTERVGRIAALLARAMGLREAEVELVRRAAPLHDVGKIGIPDEILLKPGKLTASEFAEMQTHTTIGVKILSGSHFPILQLAAEVALTHHERWDGSGYPHGLAREAIPLPGRIVAVVDVFDALTHERPYKAAWPVGAAVAELRRQRGRQFDPTVVTAFLTLQAEHPLEFEQGEASSGWSPQTGELLLPYTPGLRKS